MNENEQTNWGMQAAIAGIAVLAIIILAGTWWTGQSAQRATEEAVRSVSMFYLDELAGRREQVVASNLQENIRNMQVAVNSLTDEDLSDAEHLQAFQVRMKSLFELEKFAFVGENNGNVYTSQGIMGNVSEYPFDPQALTGPEIAVKDLDTPDKRVIIAIPIKPLSFEGDTLIACFMEIDMHLLIEGLSLQSDTNNTTFCNIYTRDGIALTDMILGGLASEDNLLDALKIADYDEGSSYEETEQDFRQGEAGHVSFTYNGITETLDYVPIKGTDWMLTYLIRESVITEQTGTITQEIVTRNLIQTIFTALALLVVFAVMLWQTRRNTRLALEKTAFEAESRVKQEEMEQRLALQEQLLEQEQKRAEQDRMITALASDYRGVYYVDLHTDDCICYQQDSEIPDHPAEGEHFSFKKRFTEYADRFVSEDFREGFLAFIEPASIAEQLKEQPIISYRYLSTHDGDERYEMLRMAGIRESGEDESAHIHAVGVGFVDVDNETRDSMAKNQALSDALAAAEEANKAKTAFLSNMSHEIRTPMNAIIGLDSIALADPDISDRTRDHLAKIGGSARHLLNLINDILDVSRIESGRMTLSNEHFSFSKLLEQINTIISSQCSDRGIDYRCQINGQVDDYYIGDDTKLRQSLINILGNAVKFTPSGGSVTFTVQRTAQFDGRTTLRFTIADTGIGMDKEFIPRIFDTFSQEDSSSTNRYGSTGLGMAITKSIIEMMNGNIEVESEKGVGSTFTVTVTLKDSTITADNDEDAIDARHLSVLVVDDDPVAIEHAELVLETAGIAAESAESGAQAVEKVRLREARRNPYNLILVDWKMPDMDGVETTRQIRAIVGDHSAIIILTAYNWEGILEQAVQAGVDSFLSKPLFASNVLEEFQLALKRKGLTKPGEAERADLAGRRILLAEDMPINAEILKELMRMRDIELEHAENGRIAVDMFAERPAGYYDAVLMDMRMPEMDGLTATAAIRAMDRPDAKTIPIIALTANAFDEDVQQSLQAGLNAHLSKPVEPESLFDTLELLIKNENELTRSDS